VYTGYYIPHNGKEVQDRNEIVSTNSIWYIMGPLLQIGTGLDRIMLALQITGLLVEEHW
jgi:hypothetical protein